MFLNGTLSSPECGIVLRLNGTTTHVEEHYAKAINYTLMVTAVSFLQVRPVREQNLGAALPCFLLVLLPANLVPLQQQTRVSCAAQLPRASNTVSGSLRRAACRCCC